MTPTIASEEAYTDWTKDVHNELMARDFDVAEAYDWFSFRSCYEDGQTPKSAVEDYKQWMTA